MFIFVNFSSLLILLHQSQIIITLLHQSQIINNLFLFCFVFVLSPWNCQENVSAGENKHLVGFGEGWSIICRLGVELKAGDGAMLLVQTLVPREQCHLARLVLLLGTPTERREWSLVGYAQ